MIPSSTFRRTLAAGTTLALAVGFAAAPVSVQVSGTSITLKGQEAFARRGRGADDPAGHVRGGKGADDPAGHVRGGKGADDPVGHVRGGKGADDSAAAASSRRGRGADDAPGDDHGRGRGRGKDDGPNHH